MKRFLPLILSIFPLFTVSAADFDGAVGELVSNNLAMKTSTLRSEAGVEALNAENVPEGPEVEFSRLWGATPETGNKWSVSVSQSFDWPGLYKARSEATRKATTAMQFLRESDFLDTRMEARLLLLDYIRNTQLLKLQQEIANNIDSMVVYYKIAVEEGLETRIDYNKTVLERISVHRDLHALEAEMEAVVMRIQEFNAGLDVAPLLDRVGDAYPDVVLMRLPMALSSIQDKDPAYAAAKAQAEVAESLVKVGRLSAFPGFSIGFEHEFEEGSNFNGFTVGITLPSWNRRHANRAARFEAQSAVLDAEMTLNKRKADIVALYRKIESFRKVLDEYTPVISDMSYQELLKKSLKAGQISFLTYIEELNYFIAAHKEYLEILYEYNLALNRTKYYD